MKLTARTVQVFYINITTHCQQVNPLLWNVTHTQLQLTKAGLFV